MKKQLPQFTSLLKNRFLLRL